MLTVNDLLRRKGREVWFTRPDAAVFDALTLMAEKNIGAGRRTADLGLKRRCARRDWGCGRRAG